MFLWHRRVLEHDGVGTSATIVLTMTGGKVMNDLLNMVADIVNSLLFPYKIDGQIDLNKWGDEWLKA